MSAAEREPTAIATLCTQLLAPLKLQLHPRRMVWTAHLSLRHDVLRIDIEFEILMIRALAVDMLSDDDVAADLFCLHVP